MTWDFHQSTGAINRPDGTLADTAYSGGDAGLFPEGINNPAFEAIQNKGPLPQGFYTIGEPIDHTRLGPFAMPLTPDMDNEMYGRGGFYIHGDNERMNRSGSDGCIVVDPQTRHEIWGSDDHRLQVIA